VDRLSKENSHDTCRDHHGRMPGNRRALVDAYYRRLNYAVVANSRSIAASDDAGVNRDRG
jgi:hypothetical protein